MPEGDNIHKARAALEPLLVGQTVTAFYQQGLHRPGVLGKRVLSVEAKGKHLLIRFEGNLLLHLHLGIRGSWVSLPHGAPLPLASRAASLLLTTTAATVLVRHAAVVELLRGEFAHAHPTLSALGPDLLAPDLSLNGVIDRARAASRSNLPIGEILLDQRVAAGIGNVYKSEVLFLERIDPWRTIGAIDEPSLLRCYERARQLLLANLGPWRRTTTADLSRGQRPPAGQGRYWVYRRSGRPCFRCRRAIASQTQGEALRVTYFCANCQGCALGRPAVWSQP